MQRGKSSVRLILTIPVLLGLLLVIGGKEDRAPAPEAVAATMGLTPRPTSLPYTEDELQSFASAHVIPVIMGQLVGGTHPLPEINARYAELSRRVTARFGKTLRIVLVRQYSVSSEDVSMSAGEKEGIPCVELIVPKLIDKRQELERSGDPRWREQFANSLVVGFLHEMDHIAFDLTTTIVDGKRSMARLVENEKRAWALTCEYTIRLLVERGAALTPSDRSYYDDWVRAGRNVKDPSWDLAIRETYREIRDAIQ